jgi:hypothetical protein
MKRKNTSDNLDRFFQRVLKNYEEDPGLEMWERIASNIPEKPSLKTKFVYKPWMLILAFFLGVSLASLYFNIRSNVTLIEQLQQEVQYKNEELLELQIKVKELQDIRNTRPNSPVAEKSPTAFNEENTLVKNGSTVNSKHDLSPKNLVTKSKVDKKPIIKLGIARTKSAVAPISQNEDGRLQPFFRVFEKTIFPQAKPIGFYVFEKSALLTDNQLIRNTFFNRTLNHASSNQNLKKNLIKNFDQLPLQPFPFKEPILKEHLLTEKELEWLKEKNQRRLNPQMDHDGITSFIAGSINPFSSQKYNIRGKTYNSGLSIKEVTGVKSSWSWSITGGFETKSNWSVQVGLDYNQLVVIKENINNVRFDAKESNAVGNGYVFSFNQHTDGAFGKVIINSTVHNQVKNDGNDVKDGDLFQLGLRTEQPVKIVRLPVMSGYRFDINERFYVTPKIGISAVWKTRDQTELSYVTTFNDRLSVQNAAIFLTNKSTQETIEAIFRAEVGFRWLPRWYVIAEPRFKYSGRPLYSYKNLELIDSPFQLMVGLRFNVD